MELQCNATIRSERFRVGVVHHLYSIQSRDVSIAFHLQEILVPLVLAHYRLVFGSGPYEPLAADIINARCVAADGAIDLELGTLGHVGGAGLELGVEKNATVAVRLAFELQREMKILV